MNGSRITGEDRRSAQIQRQHSQEMALRLLIQLGFDDLGEDPDLNEVFSKVKLFTDWFERDIGDAVALRMPTAEPNGEHALLDESQRQGLKNMVGEGNYMDGVLDACCMDAMRSPWENGQALDKMTKTQARVFVQNLRKVNA